MYIFELVQSTFLVSLIVTPLAISLGVIAAIFALRNNRNSGEKEVKGNTPNGVVILPQPAPGRSLTTKEMWKFGAILGTCLFIALTVFKIMI